MPDVKLIAMDMDGTLLGKVRGVIPPGNLAALQAAAQAGIQLCLASGRAPDDVSFHAVDAGIDVHVISLNGGVMLHKPLGEISYNRVLNPQDARAVYRMTQEANLPCAVFCQHEVIICNPPSYEGSPKPTWGTFMNRDRGRTRILTDAAELESRFDRVSKFVITAITEPERMPPLRRRIEAELPGVEVCSSWIDNIEINPKGVNKGAALKMLAQQLDIPMEQVMAIGDNDNDISMLREAGIGVAMGNATPAALEAADYVTLPCLEDGVAAAIYALALGRDIPGVKALR